MGSQTRKLLLIGAAGYDRAKDGRHETGGCSASHDAWLVNTLNHIRNFLRIDDGLATSGMPQPDDFAAFRQAGFDVVLNVACRLW